MEVLFLLMEVTITFLHPIPEVQLIIIRFLFGLKMITILRINLFYQEEEIKLVYL